MGVIAPKSKQALRSMNHKLVDGVLYVRHRERAVRDEEWQEMLEDIGRNLRRGAMLKIFVKTDNAGPDAVQRGKINDLVTSKGGTLRIAVLSSSMMVRGIVTAFSWMRLIQIKSFGLSDYEAAIRYLEANVTAHLAERAFGDIERVVG